MSFLDDIPEEIILRDIPCFFALNDLFWKWQSYRGLFNTAWLIMVYEERFDPELVNKHFLYYCGRIIQI